MFKKIKDNKYYQKFKEMRADPKLKPITSLIFWFIFLVVLVLFTRSISSPSKVVKTDEVKQELSNFKFTYTNNSGVIFGENYNDKLEFIYNNSRYYYNGKKVYLISNQSLQVIPNFDLGVLKITPNLIDNLTSNLTYNMSNGAKQYIVPLSRFINLYEYDTEVDLSLANNYNIILEVYEKNSKVYMYKLDLSNYYTFRGLNNSGILTIDIYDGQSDFSKFYDKIIGGVV